MFVLVWTQVWECNILKVFRERLIFLVARKWYLIYTHKKNNFLFWIMSKLNSLEINYPNLASHYVTFMKIFLISLIIIPTNKYQDTTSVNDTIITSLEMSRLHYKYSHFYTVKVQINNQILNLHFYSILSWRGNVMLSH